MKKLLLICSTVIFVFLLCINIYAEEAESANSSECTPGVVNTQDMRYPKSPFNKLGRGVINATTCWIEIPAEVCRVSEKKGPIVGCTLGLAEGFFTTLLRGATGIFDAVTFIIPPYNKPLMQPEYALDSFGESFNDYSDEQARP